MIRERLTSATLRAISYDSSAAAAIVEFTDGQRALHQPVPYTVYSSIVASRFPEKTYRHLVADRVLPVADMGTL